MKNVERAGHTHLGSLINNLKEGHYVIPDFQRDFECRGMFRNYFAPYSWTIISARYYYGRGIPKTLIHSAVNPYMVTKAQWVILE